MADKAAKSRFYVVWKGRQPGVFRTWEACKAQVEGFPGAQFEAFDTLAQAEQAFAVPDVARRLSLAWRLAHLPPGVPPPLLDSYAVDAACSGNPGIMEYRCVDLATGEEVFRGGPYHDATNNLGEFLAIVRALMLCQRDCPTKPIYSDSDVAIRWVRQRACRTQINRTARNAVLFEQIEQAECWLCAHGFQNPLLKWRTDWWGEIPADFGRK